MILFSRKQKATENSCSLLPSFPPLFCRWYCPPGKMASNWQLSRTTLRPILSENFVQGQRGRRSCWQLRPPSWWAQHLSLPKAKRGVATAGVAQLQDKPCRMSFAERVMFRAGKKHFLHLLHTFFQTWRQCSLTVDNSFVWSKKGHTLCLRNFVQTLLYDVFWFVNTKDLRFISQKLWHNNISFKELCQVIMLSWFLK